jgi:hypothetical protein
MGVLGVSSFERPTADYLNRSLNDFAIDLLYYFNASAVGNLSSLEEMAPMSEFNRDSQEWMRLLSLVDRFLLAGSLLIQIR